MKLCNYFQLCKKNKKALYCKNIPENGKKICTMHSFKCLATHSCKNIKKNGMQFCSRHERTYKYNITDKICETISELDNEICYSDGEYQVKINRSYY